MHRYTSFSTLLALIVLLMIGCQPAPSGPRTAGAPPVEPQTRDAFPTVTPVAEEEALPLPEATQPAFDPEAAPTLQPTAVPIGLYVQELSGLILTYPSGWEVLSETGREIEFNDTFFDLYISVESRFASEEDTYEALVDELLELDFFAAAVGAEEMSLMAEGELPFAGDGTAQTALVGAEGEDGEIALWLAFAKHDTRVYQFLVIGEPDTIAARERTLQEMLVQVTFGPSGLYGYARGETLVMLGGTPFNEDIDPALTRGSAAGYVGYLNRGLVRLTSTLQIVPDLAESWAISDDGTVYTFILRETAFANGDPITAADVVASWERATAADSESTTARTYLGDILGVLDKLDGEAESIVGLNVVDERTLEVTLDGPKPYFLAKLTYPTSFVVDVDSVDEEDEEPFFDANTSGPYEIGEIRPDEAVILVRNEGYHSPPDVAQIVFLTDRAGSSRSLFEAGEVDMVGISDEDAQEIAGSDDADLLYSTTSLCTTLVQVNNTLPPFDDVDVRRAFALAVDKENYNELISDGNEIIASTILPPPMPGFSVDLAEEMADLYGYDPEAAVAALERSSYGGQTLPEIRLLASGFGDSDRDDLNALIASWQEVLGVTVVIEFIDPFNFNEIARDDPGHMTSYGWCADYPDPENFLDILYYSASDFNVASFNDPDIDAQLEAARTTLDPAERLALYQALERTMIDQVVAIPLQHGVGHRLVAAKIEGFVESPMGTQFIDDITLNADAAADQTEEGE